MFIFSLRVVTYTYRIPTIPLTITGILVKGWIGIAHLRKIKKREERPQKAMHAVNFDTQVYYYHSA